MGSPRINYPDASASEEALRGKQVEALTQQNQMLMESYQQQKALEPLFYEAAGLVPTKDEKGKIVGFTKAPLTEEQQLQNEINKLELTRSKQALAGELPLDPAVERQFTEAGTDLEERMLRQYGGNWRDTTSGRTAMANYAQRKAETVSALQHGDIGMYEGLSMARQGQLDAQTQQLLQRASFVPGSLAQGGLTFGQSAAGYTPLLAQIQEDRKGSMMQDYYRMQIPTSYQRWGQSGGALGMVISDKRLKKIIARLWTDMRGFGVYLFRYIWGPTLHLGVIAQEVAPIVPEAVVATPSGLLVVDYTRLFEEN